MSPMRSGPRFKNRATRPSGFSAILRAALLAVPVAGCGNDSTTTVTPATTATPPAAPPPVAAPPVGDHSIASRAAPRSGDPIAATSPRRSGSAPSGDIEPPGREATFVVLDDPGVGGSVFAYASDDGAGNFDRFGFLSTPRSDSGRFLAVTDAASATTAPAIAAGPVRLPPGFTALAGTNYSPDGYPLRIRCEKDGAVMAYVSEGVFLQGKNGQDANAAPEHGVALDRFYIDIYEVTWENYEKYRDASRASKRLIAEPAVKPGDPAMPVTGISWAEARGYAVWSGRDLPSEAEWEKAARGTEGFDFPWGNGTYVWQRPRLPGQIDPVGSFPCDLSPLGVYDMAGNAREWCSDLYQSEYYARLVRESGATAHNPTGPKSSTGTNQRVVKGGSAQWHVWVRDGVTMNERAPDIGFRCVWHPTAGAKKR